MNEWMNVSEGGPNSLMAAKIVALSYDNESGISKALYQRTSPASRRYKLEDVLNISGHARSIF